MRQLPFRAHHPRAVRAAFAVTLVGTAGCGTDPVDDPADAASDVASDAAGDVQADATVDADALADTSLCSLIDDSLCPESCSELDDYNCCDDYCGGPGWGFLNGGDCNCAVEGPFAPPSFDRPRALPRTVRLLEVA